MEDLNEVWIVWELTSFYSFSIVYYGDKAAQKAKEHVELRSLLIKETEMDGRRIFCKKYVVLE